MQNNPHLQKLILNYLFNIFLTIKVCFGFDR